MDSLLFSLNGFCLTSYPGFPFSLIFYIFQCKSGLHCLQRNGWGSVPGCPNANSGQEEYCIAKPRIDSVGNNGRPSSVYPLGLCQGDCDKHDHECDEGLVCFHRENTTEKKQRSHHRNLSCTGLCGRRTGSQSYHFCVLEAKCVGGSGR